ncbi:hypothetical protein ACHAO9_011902 [Fusarium lateritium]
MFTLPNASPKCMDLCFEAMLKARVATLFLAESCLAMPFQIPNMPNDPLVLATNSAKPLTWPQDGWRSNVSPIPRPQGKTIP